MNNLISRGIAPTTTQALPMETATGMTSVPITTQIHVKPIIGLPAGTIKTETTTSENFITKYKMPLIIGAVAIGYFFLRKK